MPYLWTLLGALLAADTKINYKCEWRSGRAPDLLQRTDSNNIEMGAPWTITTTSYWLSLINTGEEWVSNENPRHTIAHRTQCPICTT